MKPLLIGRKCYFVSLLIYFLLFWLSAANALSAENENLWVVDEQIAKHPGLTGVLMLDKGEDALLARAWLAERALKSIDVQYFIWSTDNIGILATEALLRAADRGVRVRVIVDDLLIDAPDKTLLALALHPNISIRIYNPKHSVGTPAHKRLLNVVTDFRGVNQRMHDKTFSVDGKVAITGGRNMADEYFDYNHEYNFRDRDILVIGEVVKQVAWNFEQFWQSELSVDVQHRFDGLGLLKDNVTVDSEEIRLIYQDLHEYARSPENFKPEVRAAIDNIPESFQSLVKEIIWDHASFISDAPGKNEQRFSLDGGGITTKELAKLIESSKERIVIQSPYLILTENAQVLFRKTIERGVVIRISTNSLASTDNLQAFSGYDNQRRNLLNMGLQIYEYKPHPAIQRSLFQRYEYVQDEMPVFAIHAKSMVIDSETVFIGTYNLDPRSENLNTEVGIVVKNKGFAKLVEDAIEIDMELENSWNSKLDNPDSNASYCKRIRAFFWGLFPIQPLL